MKTKFVTTRKSFFEVRIDQYYQAIKFSDYPDKKAALKAAINCRDEYLRDRGQLYRLEKGRRVRTKDKRNTTGVLNVRKSWKRAGNNSWARYTGHYFTKQKETLSKCFGVTKYGEERAFVLACEFVYQHQGYLRIVDQNVLPIRMSLMVKHFANIKFDK